MRQNIWVRTLDTVIESGWLLALVAIPIFFDTMTVRIFEPDKIVLFRNIMLFVVLALLVRMLFTWPASMSQRREAPPTEQGDEKVVAMPGWRRELERRPMLIPVAIFVVIYTIATIHSVLPWISFWGSYDRMQGLYTWLNYIALFVVISYQVRTWGQIERIISAMVFTSLPVSFYGVMQHYQWDPVPWGADTTERVSSTLGNSIFLGAYLIMCMPFVGYRIWRSVERWQESRREKVATAQAAQTARESSKRTTTRRAPQKERGVIEINGFHPLVPVVVYSLIMLCDFAGLYFCGSRGPYYGLVAAVFVIGFPLTLKWSNPFPAMASIVLAMAIFGFPQVASKIGSVTSPSNAAGQHLTDLSINGTSEVRQLIWQGSIPLIKANPILGYGPETMIYVYSPYYLAALGHVEHANAAPDRNHDEWLDFLVFSGVLGLAAWLGILITFFVSVVRLLRRPMSRRATVLIVLIASTVIGHLVEASVGIDIVSTLMLLWLLFGLFTVFQARPELLGEPEAAPVVVPTAAPVAPAAKAAAGQRGGGQQRPPRGGAQQRPGRGGARPAPTPAFSLDRLSGGQQLGMLGLVVVLLVGLVGGGMLFSNNVQVVNADASYKVAQAMSTQLQNCLKLYQSMNDPSLLPGCPIQQGTTQSQLGQIIERSLLPETIGTFQQAISDQPHQDMYYLWLGSAYLAEASYYNMNKRTSDAATAFQAAVDALLTAQNLNPKNADHPMNLARVYTNWASNDPTKWPLADKYYQQATALARHNGRWWDEWVKADMVQAQYSPTLSPAQRTTLREQALHNAQHAAEVDDQLADALVYQGQIYDSLTNFTAAATAYTTAIKINQGFEIYTEPQTEQSLLTSLSHVTTSADLARLSSAALPVIKAASKADSNGPATHDLTLARLYTSWAAQADSTKWPQADSQYKLASDEATTAANDAAAQAKATTDPNQQASAQQAAAQAAQNAATVLDEWGNVKVTEAEKAVGLTVAQRQSLRQAAVTTFQQAAVADSALNDTQIYLARAYDAQGNYAAAAATYVNALKVNTGYQNVGTRDAVQGLITDLFNANDFAAIVRPINFGNTLGTQTPLTLVYSPTLTLAGSDSPISATLDLINKALKARGLVK